MKEIKNKMRNGNKNAIIIGSGRLGSVLAYTLSNINYDVTVIDQNENAIKNLDVVFGGLTLVGDATDINVLKEAGIEKADIVVVATNNDNVNIMISLIAKEIFNIKKVIARLYDENRGLAYNKLDIDIVSPSQLSAEALKNKIICKEDTV